MSTKKYWQKLSKSGSKNLILFLLFSLASCSAFWKNKNERALARVYDVYLYDSDIKGVIPKGTSPGDSVVLIQSYIDSWIRKQLIIHLAETNLSSEQMDFSKQLENYKNAMLTYTYENALVRQKLDTLVTDEEMESYYDANQNNFLLKDNIVQLRYVKLPLSTTNKKIFRTLLNASDEGDRMKLAELCEKTASDYFLDDQNWLLFNDVLRQIPVKTYNQEEFLKNHRDLEYQDSNFVYLVRFKDFKIKEGISPLSFEKPRIKEIILNKRKLDLLSRMQDDIYQQALKKNDFEKY